MSDKTREIRRRVPVLIVLPVLVFVTLAGALYWGLRNNDDRLPSALIGKPVPEFDLPAIEGRNDGLATTDIVGDVSIVNVWASWCVPCRVENPLMVELAKTGEVPIYGINYRDSPDAALMFLNELGDPFTRIGADRNGRVAIEWGVYGVPETYVIDGEGRIAYKHVGPFDRSALEEEILPIVRRLKAESGS